MRRLLDELLLLKAIRALSPRRERAALALYLLVGAVASASIAVRFSPSLDAELIAVHHFRPKSWPAWGALQLLPKMYSFAHTCWIGPPPQREDEPPSVWEERISREGFWVNHYPARRARFDGGRDLLGPGRTRYVYVRTSYCGITETTGFTVRIKPGALVLRRRAEAP